MCFGVDYALKYSSSCASACCSVLSRSLMILPCSSRAMRDEISVVCCKLWLDISMVA